MLLPTPVEDVDPYELFAADERPVPAARPWVMCNMVASVDGATTIAGVSGRLGGAADRKVFHVIRGICDVVLAGAGTVRAERYGLPEPDPETIARRRAAGMAPTPRLAVVSRSLDLEPGLPFLTAAHTTSSDDRALILTAPDSADRFADRAANLLGCAELVACGTTPGSVDLVAALAELRERGASTVLTEGGPMLNGNLMQAGMLDELLITTAPTLAGGSSKRVIDGPEHVVDLTLTRLLEEDGVLFSRYLRLDASGEPDPGG